MAGNPEAASNDPTAERPTNPPEARRCIVVGRMCLETCTGPLQVRVAYGGQGGTEEAGGMGLDCPMGQEPNLDAELYYCW